MTAYYIVYITYQIYSSTILHVHWIKNQNSPQIWISRCLCLGCFVHTNANAFLHNHGRQLLHMYPKKLVLDLNDSHNLVPHKSHDIAIQSCLIVKLTGFLSFFYESRALLFINHNHRNYSHVVESVIEIWVDTPNESCSNWISQLLRIMGN
jgi:hypothetical protein